MRWNNLILRCWRVTVTSRMSIWVAHIRPGFVSCILPLSFWWFNFCQHKPKKPEIVSSLFYNNPHLKRLDMSAMYTTVPSQLFTPAGEIEWLSLDQNVIPVLTPLIVKNKSQLRYLSMAECQIGAVLDSTFAETGRLEVLILSSNNIKFMTTGQLKGLTSLRTLGKFLKVIFSLLRQMIQIWATTDWNQLAVTCSLNRQCSIKLTCQRMPI